MRLLQRKSAGSFEFTGDLMENVPKYAILSHTWLADDKEVTFKDMKRGRAQRKPAGFHKINFCGEQAAKDGPEYLWVDTCCINKSSSAELQESIMTMFHWYRKSTKCYVYLADVSLSEAPVTNEAHSQSWVSAFLNSRWFTRGWTLQELIAPSSVDFFSAQGTWLGDKKSLEHYIHEITGISCRALRGASLSEFSVAKRLSWAEKRKTKRKEDE